MTKLDEFLNDYEAETQRSYKISLEQFFEWKHTNADNYIENIKKMDFDELEETLCQYRKDIKEYWQHLKTKYKPKYTRNAKLNAVRQLLIKNEIELPIIFWKSLKKTKEKGATAATQDRAPTRHELRKIILEGKPIARTMFLIGACTGMRLGEIMQLKKGDIDLSMDPIWINIRGETTKTGDPRTVYVSDEAAIYLRQWMNGDRAVYLANIKQRMQRMSQHKKYKDFADKHQHDDGRVFPITRQAAESYWQLMLKRACLDQRDPTTNIRVLHTHTLRKFFRTSMAKPLGVDVVEAIMGHRGYLTDAYRRYSKHDLAKLYKENQEYVTIIQEPKALEKLDAENKAKDERIQKLEEKVEQFEQLLGLRKSIIEEINRKK